MGGEYLYIPGAWPRIDAVNKLAIIITVTLPYTFLYLAAFGDPGYITHANHAFHMQLYPYDFSIFHPGVECRTCRFLKPPRSKHCAVCKKCVSKMDHHCIFLNKCVGYGNHGYFLLLLLSTAVLLSYGSLLGVAILSAKMKAAHPLWSIWKPSDMNIHYYLLVWGWGVQDHVGLGAITLLVSMLAPMVWGLLAYTVYLVWCGVTTNESLKWSDWSAEMADGYAFKRRMSPNRQKFTAVEPSATRWPHQTEQIIVRTENGQPPARDARLAGEGDWQRVWKLTDVDNMYHLGFKDNLVDIFCPNYNFNADRLPGMKAKKRPPRLTPF